MQCKCHRCSHCSHCLTATDLSSMLCNKGCPLWTVRVLWHAVCLCRAWPLLDAIHPIYSWLPVMVESCTNLMVLVARPAAGVICFLVLGVCPLEVGASCSFCVFLFECVDAYLVVSSSIVLWWYLWTLQTPKCISSWLWSYSRYAFIAHDVPLGTYCCCFCEYIVFCLFLVM